MGLFPNTTRVRAGLYFASILTALWICSGCGGEGGGDDGGGNEAGESIARTWDEANLAAIRIDTPRPPVHARNLWHLSVAMYDAWAAFDSVAHGYLLTEKHSLPQSDIASARREAISYAAYTVLKSRYALSVNAEKTSTALDKLMGELGYDVLVTSPEGVAPSAIGLRAASAVLALGDKDGSNQQGNYADPSYTPSNAPLIVAFPGNVMMNPNLWQPLALAVAFTQNGLPEPSGLQKFIGSQWGNVIPFALTRVDARQPYIVTGEPPLFGEASDGLFKQEMFDLIRKSSTLSDQLPATIDISPGAYGNNPLASNSGTGHPINPVTGGPYPSQPVKVGDFERVLAEFWADGPSSETPPGHWNTIANLASDSRFQAFRFEGQGPPLDRLEWDVKLYFAINGALHDAAVNCWGVKRKHDSVRPISAIRMMATLGQSSSPGIPSYNPGGLPLEPGLSELITDATWPNGRHAGIICCVSNSGEPAPCVDSAGNPGTQVSCVGEVAVMSWPGSPADRVGSASGVRWIRAREWTPYQLDTFVSPAFPGFNSGHSTFSRSAAEVLAAFTGSEFFPGGLGEFVARKNGFLTFERGPSEEVRLQWGTYFDAADQAGQSRLFGGIHIQSDDFTGRAAGSQIGRLAFAKAKEYFLGTINSASE